MITEEQRKHNEEIKSKMVALIGVQEIFKLGDLGFCHGVFQDIYVSDKIKQKFKNLIEELITDIIIDLASKFYTETTQKPGDIWDKLNKKG